MKEDIWLENNLKKTFVGVKYRERIWHIRCRDLCGLKYMEVVDGRKRHERILLL